jgi:inhibitor of cysteine peptidase
MSGCRIIVSVLVILTTCAIVLPVAVSAQAPQLDPPWTGVLPPPDGLGILQASREAEALEIVARLRQEGCNAASLAVTEEGAWLTFVPGAPAFVNTSFPATLAVGQVFIVRCGAENAPVVVRTGDDGATIHLAVHAHLTVALPANPSTGYAWRIDPELPATVLSPIGEPTFVPRSALVGAPGTTTLEFLATGPGLVELRLVYDRVFEAAPPEATWTATVTVSGQQTVAWLGEIRTQPAARPDARYLELRQPALPEGSVPAGAGIVGSDGATSNAIAAFSDTGQEVLVWGELTCGVIDYGDCRIDATTILLASTAPVVEPYPVIGWLGTIGSLPASEGPGDYFQLAGRFPVQYGIAGETLELQAQLVEARELGQRLRVWGTLHAPVDDVNHTRIVVTEIALAP